MNNVECCIVPQPPQEGETRTFPWNVTQTYRGGTWHTREMNIPCPPPEPRQVVLSMPYEVAKKLRQRIGGMSNTAWGDVMEIQDALDSVLR